MSSSPVLPVEIWQAILRYAISVYRFLDPDSFEPDLNDRFFSQPNEEDGEYWASERTRNVLRRVCVSFDQYLRRFEHRFVRMADILHGRVDEMALKSAIRISFAIEQCACTAVCHPPERSGGPFTWAYRRYGELCCEKIWSFSFLPAEIVDMRGGQMRRVWNSGALRSLSKVKVVITQLIGGDGIDYPLFHQTPSIQHLCGTVYDDLLHLQFVSRTLVSLSLRVDQEEACKRFLFDLPSLRHLHIRYSVDVRSSVFFAEVLMPLMQTSGAQLRSLFVDGFDIQCTFPFEIWRLCPLLVRLEPSAIVTTPPPESHPIRILVVQPYHLLDTLKWLWPNLACIFLDGIWSDLTTEHFNELYENWTREIKDGGVMLEDMNGLTVEEAMEAKRN